MKSKVKQLLLFTAFLIFATLAFSQIKDEKHYHVPITLSAFGYSTYRGN